MRPARLAVERGREAREVLIGPGGGDAETGVDQEENRATQGRKEFEGLNELAAPGGQRRFALEKKRDVGAEKSGDELQLFRRQRLAEEFV